MNKYLIQPQSGIRIDVNEGQRIEVGSIIYSNGKIEIKKPLSKAGDKIILKALVDCVLVISACSVSECDTNSGICTAIAVYVE